MIFEVAVVAGLSLFLIFMVVFFRKPAKPPQPTIKEVNEAINRATEEGKAVVTTPTHHVVIKSKSLADTMRENSEYVPENDPSNDAATSNK